MSNEFIIETERLFLTYPNKQQIEQYYIDIIGSSMFKTLLWDGPSKTEDLLNYWSACLQLNPHDLTLPLSLAVIEKSSDRYIGGCSLRPLEGNEKVLDIGFAFAPKYHGQGFATEAVRAMTHEAFLKRKAQRVFGNVFVGNVASKHVFEKLDYQYEGTLRSMVLKQNEWMDEWIMAIIHDDWKSSSVYFPE